MLDIGFINHRWHGFDSPAGIIFSHSLNSSPFFFFFLFDFHLSFSAHVSLNVWLFLKICPSVFSEFTSLTLTPSVSVGLLGFGLILERTAFCRAVSCCNLATLNQINSMPRQTFSYRPFQNVARCDQSESEWMILVFSHGLQYISRNGNVNRFGADWIISL